MLSNHHVILTSSHNLSLSSSYNEFMSIICLTDSTDASLWKASERASESPTSGTAQPSDISGDVESDSCRTLSMKKESCLVVLHSRHKLMARLMRQVYSICDPHWKGVREHAGSSSSHESVPGEKVQYCISQQIQKRRRDGQDSSPPDDRRYRKKHERHSPFESENDGRVVAYPLHKRDPNRYCCSAVNGARC